MGSWSEACGFSGLEIAEGDTAYCCLIAPNPRGSLNDGAFHHYVPTTTLIKGTYNDYGRLRVDDDEAIIAMFPARVANGEDFGPDDHSGYRWWIHGDAFDFIPKLVPDFPYYWDSEVKNTVKIANIGESIDAESARLRKVAADVKAKLAETSDPVDRELVMLSTIVTEAMGGYGPIPGIDRDALKKAMMEGSDIEHFIEARRRISLVHYAMSELRRCLAPNESVGPQWGGHAALGQFGQFLVEKCNDHLQHQA